MVQNTPSTGIAPSSSNAGFSDFLHGLKRQQAANVMVAFHLAEIKKFVRSTKHEFSKKLSLRQNILSRIKCFLNDPNHAKLKKAVMDSKYYNGGDYEPLLNKITHGL